MKQQIESAFCNYTIAQTEYTTQCPFGRIKRLTRKNTLSFLIYRRKRFLKSILLIISIITFSEWHRYHALFHTEEVNN